MSLHSTSSGERRTVSSIGMQPPHRFAYTIITFNSRLYNEKAYVLSRGFVRRALEIPLGSLEQEMAWLYHSRGKLRKVLEDARALVQKSREEPVDSVTVVSSDRAVPRLTSGAIITLERTLTKLEGLQQLSS